MKKLYPIIFCLNLLLMLLFQTSCKERPCEEKPVLVDTAIVAEIVKEPLQSYTGFDTLKFLTDKGDTITFMGQGLNTGYNKVDIYAEDYCSTKSITYKQFTGYTFYPLNPYPTELEYYISRNLNSSGGTYFYILINKFTFYRGASLPPLHNSAYINGLEINGNIYNNVLKIKKDFYSNDSHIYYSKSEGIIQVIFPDGSTLTKIK